MIQTELNAIQNFQGKYPKQLWYLFFSEMWERFCFYGMRGMLTFFMVNQLFMEEDTANLQYGSTQAFVYAFTFIGGLFADKILGFRRSLFWGGILMITGSLILAFDPRQFFFLGISFTIIGTGFFKPNISTMVGALYRADDNRRDAGFSLFYSGINIGALFGGYICVAIGKGALLQDYVPDGKSWNVAFGAAAVVMTISLLIFLYTQKTLGSIGISPLKNESGSNRKFNLLQLCVYLGSLAAIPLIMVMVSKTDYTDYFMYTIGPLSLIYLVYQATQYDSQTRMKLLAAFVFILFSIVFWAFFEQSGGSLSLFAANNLNDHLMGGAIKADPNGVNNAANSLFVIILAPLIGLLWIFLSRRKVEPNSVVKFGLGFLFLAASFYVFYLTRFFADSNGIASLDTFTAAYLIITLGELCLSPIGLSLMTKLSPTRMQGVMMGMWFLASAYGQYVAGILGAGMTSPKEDASSMDKLISYTNGYYQLSIYALVCGLILLIISPWVRKLMMDVK